MTKLIIFDFDDTITDNFLLDFKSFYFTCKKFGIKCPTKNKILKFRLEGLLANDISKQLIDNNSVPNEYICPISQKLMIDPATTLVGNTYEKSYIKEWLKDHDTDPLFNETLTDKNLIDNKGLKETIELWVSKL